MTPPLAVFLMRVYGASDYTDLCSAASARIVSSHCEHLLCKLLAEIVNVVHTQVLYVPPHQQRHKDGEGELFVGRSVLIMSWLSGKPKFHI